MAIEYNGVSLPFPLTEQHVTEADRDPTGVDTTTFRTRIVTQGVIAPGLYPAAEGESPAQTADRIAHLLCSPRRTLRYTQGTKQITVVPGVDDENGPQPEPGAFSIRHVSEGSFVVTFAVSFKLRRCTGADARGFLSLKWADAVQYAEDWTCTRRRTGLLITSRRLRSPDELRHVVTPAEPAGFRRQHASYELSEDGLRLRFTFVDVQRHKSPPWAAVKMTGHQVETVPRGGGMRRGELSLRLSGPPGVPARDLLGAAITVGLSRVYASKPQLDARTNQIMMGCVIRESLADTETTIELGLDWMIAPAAQRSKGSADGSRNTLRGAGWGGVIGGVIGGIPGAIGGAITGGTLANSGRENRTPENRPKAAIPTLAGWVGTPIPAADPNAGIAPPTRGVERAAYLKLVAAALMDPCGSTASLNSVPGTNDNYLVGTDPTGATTELRSGPANDPTEESVYADDRSPGIWEHWLMRYTFRTVSGYDVVGSTKPNTAGAMIRVTNREKHLRVEWELRRTGDSPALPEPKIPQPGGCTGDGSSDPNWCGIESTVCYENVDVAADGVSFTYTAAGESTWKAVDPYAAYEGYPVPPWLAPAKKPTPAVMTRVPPTPSNAQLPGNPFLNGGSSDGFSPFGGTRPLP